MTGYLVNQEMFITKSSFSNGEMRWSAVNSDTAPDLYGERMSLELYQKMLSYIRDKVPPPEQFKSMVCSDFWSGGMPYLSLSHFPDLNGKAVPGMPQEIFIDGSRLKAKGVLFDTPLGHAVWKSLKKDEALDDDNKIRISIAFLDLAHKHGDSGKVFTRLSATSVCPECLAGKKEKIYVDGYLVHLALTRVPVNPRTIMEEDTMAKKSKITTRLEDAESIVEDKSILEEALGDAVSTKSDVLVEMSDAPVADEPVVEEAKTKKDMPAEEEDSEEDTAEDSKEKKGKKECSLTEGDIEIIRSLIVEALPKLETKSDTVSEAEVEKSALDVATDNLYNSVQGAIALSGATLEERLESINPSLQELGASITALVRDSMGQPAPTAQANDQGLLMEAITSLSNTVKSLATEVATLKSSAMQNTTPETNKVPVPRSITPQQVLETRSLAPVKPNSVDNIARRSVSSNLPLK